MTSDLNPQRHLAARVDDPDTDRAAVRAVLLRVERGQLTAAQGHTVMQALGLAPYLDGGRTDENGARQALTRAEQRRRATHNNPVT